MRMWMVKPELLCDKHLLGEHGELHKHRHNFVKRQKIDGRIFPVVQIEPANMKRRHDTLAKEMLKRGFNHKSPYEQPDISHLPIEQQTAVADVEQNIIDLTNRCEDCAARIAMSLTVITLED